jgi:restriction system protein
MPRRGRQSDADRALAELSGLLVMVPAWVGPLLAVGAFAFTYWVIPAILSLGGEGVANVFPPVARKLAPWVAVVVLVVWIVAEFKKRSRRRLLNSQSDAESLRAMSWQEFEQLVGEAFRRMGYRVKETGGGGTDGGVDLRLHRDGRTTLVQCKQWKTWKIGVKIVRELFGVMTAEGAARGIVVCCGRFTREAVEFAADKPIELVDGEALWKLVSNVKDDQATSSILMKGDESRRSSEVPDHAASSASPSAPPVCPKCGAAMVQRTARRGNRAGEQFWGCPKYPACRGIRQLGT